MVADLRVVPLALAGIDELVAEYSLSVEGRTIVDQLVYSFQLLDSFERVKVALDVHDRVLRRQRVLLVELFEDLRILAIEMGVAAILIVELGIAAVRLV